MKASTFGLFFFAFAFIGIMMVNSQTMSSIDCGDKVPEVIVSDNVLASIKALVEALLDAIKTLAVANRPFITIGLSGGEQIHQLSREIISHFLNEFRVHASKIRFIFVDEKFIKEDPDDTSFQRYKSHKLFELIGVSKEQVFPVKSNASSAEECAVDYQERLTPLLNENGGFDILIFGAGPDGHMASIFPGHPLFTNASAQEKSNKFVLSITDSPKPPPQRVTLSLAVMQKSTYLLFQTGGPKMSDAMNRILKGKDMSLPSTNVLSRQKEGVTKWFLDKSVLIFD